MLVEMEIKSVRDRVLLLRSLPTFATLDEAALMPMAEASRVRRFRAGDILASGNDAPKSIHLVTTGSVRMERLGLILHATRARPSVGLLPALARDTEGLAATAEEDCTTIEVPADALFEAMSHDFSVIRHLFRLMSRVILERRNGLPAHPAFPPSDEIGTYRATERTLVERLLRMRDSPMGQLANMDAAAELARALKERRFRAGEVIWREGDNPTGWCSVDYGRVSCERADGPSVVIGSAYQFGIFECMADVPRGYTARALTPVVMDFADFADHLSVLEVHGSLATGLVSLIAKALMSNVRADAEEAPIEGSALF